MWVKLKLFCVSQLPTLTAFFEFLFYHLFQRQIIFLRVTRVRGLTKVSSFILISFTCHTSQGCQIAQQVILMLIQSCQVSGINFCGSYCLWVPSLGWLLSPGSCWVLLRLLTVSWCHDCWVPAWQYQVILLSRDKEALLDSRMPFFRPVCTFSFIALPCIPIHLSAAMFLWVFCTTVLRDTRSEEALKPR